MPIFAVIAVLKVNFFSEGMFLYKEFSLLQSKHPLFCIFLDYFSRHFLLRLMLLRHNSYHCNVKVYLEITQKIGKKVGIHFWENILSEINLPLLTYLIG